MKDRLITLLFALAAFLLSIFLLMPPPTSEEPVSMPTTEDRGAHGLQGLYRWLQVNQTAVFSLKDRYSYLTMEDLSESGNLLILSMPQQQKALSSEWNALQDWVDSGNTVLVLAAGYFAPEWSQQGDCFCEIKKLLRGFNWEIDSSREDSDKEDKPENEAEADMGTFSFKQNIENLKQGLETIIPKQTKLQPQSGHTLLHGVSTIQSKITPSLQEREWSIENKKNNLALKLLSLAKPQNLPVMWQIEAGSGQIFLSLVPDIFSNENLNKANNARFFNNILAQSLGENGQIIFDDYHFGLSNLYDPKKFFGDSRLHKTLGFIGLLWLFYVLGYSNRLAPVHIGVEKPSAKDFVNAMAGFFSRRLDKKTLAQELTRRLIHDVRQHKHLHDDPSAWQWLQQHPGLQTAQLVILQRAEQKQRTQLQHLTHTISEIRNKVLL